MPRTTENAWSPRKLLSLTACVLLLAAAVIVLPARSAESLLSGKGATEVSFQYVHALIGEDSSGTCPRIEASEPEMGEVKNFLQDLNIRWHGEEEPQHYNSQAGTFTQAVRETHALMLMQGGEFESECIGLGDLYVTIFSGRTRRCGVLMGKGLNYDQVTEALAGITLESLVITRIMGNAIRRKAELGLVDLRDFPLLMHIVDILDHGKSDSDIPWEAFTFEHLK